MEYRLAKCLLPHNSLPVTFLERRKSGALRSGEHWILFSAIYYKRTVELCIKQILKALSSSHR
jgi:hypothetical protein